MAVDSPGFSSYYVVKLTELLARENNMKFNPPCDFRKDAHSHGEALWQSLEQQIKKQIEDEDSSDDDDDDDEAPVTDTGTQTTPHFHQHRSPPDIPPSTDQPTPRAPQPKNKELAKASVASLPVKPPTPKAALATTTSQQKGKGKEERTTHTSPLNPPNNPPSSGKGMERVHPDRIPQIQAGWISAKKPATVAPPPNTPKTTNRTQAVVLHAAPMRYKPGLMRRWIEEDNQGARILGIRWLLQEGRRAESWRHHSLSTWRRGSTLHTGFAWASESSAPQHVIIFEFFHLRTVVGLF
ncbi:hypothetical protein BGX38DRAFT_1332969 [Terfezia claveryi]|nr:hypothetical protein BGX38DRAFT_1332969 [Terfezia claveryi]